MNHISLKIGRPRCYAKSHRTHFGQYQLKSQLARVTRRWGLPSHAQNAVRWLALSIQYVCMQIINTNAYFHIVMIVYIPSHIQQQ